MQLSDFSKSLSFSKKGFMKIFIPLMLLLFIAIAIPSFAQDPSGANTGAIGDVTAATAGKPTADEVGAQAGHNKIAINIMWTLITRFLVMFMQASVCFVFIPDGFYGYYGYHSYRFNGREMEIQIIFYLRIFHFNVCISNIRKLGLGRRMAFTIRR